MENLRIYEQSREVPENAQKTIGGGRLKGMTDINPMWRIKKLTELFGPCGEGWGYDITHKEIIPGANGEVAAFVDIILWYKVDGKKADPIPGTGGSMFVAKEKNGLYTDDECFKKALTDAISVAAKALGVGADVYWQKDRTKYTTATETPWAMDGVKIESVYMAGKTAGMDKEKMDQVIKYNYKKTIDKLTLDEYRAIMGTLNGAKA